VLNRVLRQGRTSIPLSAGQFCFLLTPSYLSYYFSLSFFFFGQEDVGLSIVYVAERCQQSPPLIRFITAISFNHLPAGYGTQLTGASFI
jgi:hypothetical protein